jgi:hypothetical protein
MDDEQLSAILSKGRLHEVVIGLEAYLKRVCEGNENPRVFHRFLPKLLLHVFGSEDKKGYIELFKTPQDVNALLSLLSLEGWLMKAIIWEFLEDEFMYEIPLTKLPSTTQTLLNYVKETKASYYTSDYFSWPGFHWNLTDESKTWEPIKTIPSAIFERVDIRKESESVMKLSKFKRIGQCMAGLL